jgi:hypothetical protein
MFCSGILVVGGGIAGWRRPQALHKRGLPAEVVERWARWQAAATLSLGYGRPTGSMTAHTTVREISSACRAARDHATSQPGSETSCKDSWCTKRPCPAPLLPQQVRVPTHLALGEERMTCYIGSSDKAKRTGGCCDRCETL